MRLVCPECTTEYDVPDAVLAAGRRLRCSACGTSWDWTPADTPLPEPARPEPAQAGPPPATAMEPAASRPAGDPAPEPAVAKPAPAGAPRIEVAPERRIVPPAPPPKRGSRLVAVAWIATFVILLAGLAALYVWRAPIMQAWPPSIRLYAALGLA